jgi:hypothetical protein
MPPNRLNCALPATLGQRSRTWRTLARGTKVASGAVDGTPGGLRPVTT